RELPPGRAPPRPVSPLARRGRPPRLRARLPPERADRRDEPGAGPRGGRADPPPHPPRRADPPAPPAPPPPPPPPGAPPAPPPAPAAAGAPAGRPWPWAWWGFPSPTSGWGSC